MKAKLKQLKKFLVNIRNLPNLSRTEAMRVFLITAPILISSGLLLNYFFPYYGWFVGLLLSSAGATNLAIGLKIYDFDLRQRIKNKQVMDNINVYVRSIFFDSETNEPEILDTVWASKSPAFADKNEQKRIFEDISKEVSELLSEHGLAETLLVAHLLTLKEELISSRANYCKHEAVLDPNHEARNPREVFKEMENNHEGDMNKAHKIFTKFSLHAKDGESGGEFEEVFPTIRQPVEET